MQLIITHELTKEKNYWLQSLRSNITDPEEIRNLAEHYEEYQDEVLYSDIMNAIRNPGMPALKINGLGTVNVFLRWKLFCKDDIIFRYGNTADGHGIVSIGRYFQTDAEE